MTRRTSKQRQIDLLQTISNMTELEELLQDVADEVHGMLADGSAEAEIDRYILGEVDELGLSAAGMKDGFPPVPGLSEEAQAAVMDNFAKLLDEYWCWAIRRFAVEGKMPPFAPLISGGAFSSIIAVDEETRIPCVIAVVTPFSDLEVAIEELREEHGKVLGREPFRNTKSTLEASEFYRMHRQGMSYRDIAIQSLRKKCPDIIEEPDRHKDELKRERSRVIKAVRAAERLWNPRLDLPSIPS